MVVALHATDLLAHKQTGRHCCGRSRLVVQVCQQEVRRSVFIVSTGRRNQFADGINPWRIFSERISKELKQLFTIHAGPFRPSDQQVGPCRRKVLISLGRAQESVDQNFTLVRSVTGEELT